MPYSIVKNLVYKFILDFKNRIIDAFFNCKRSNKNKGVTKYFLGYRFLHQNFPFKLLAKEKQVERSLKNLAFLDCGLGL